MFPERNSHSFLLCNWKFVHSVLHWKNGTTNDTVKWLHNKVAVMLENWVWMFLLDCQSLHCLPLLKESLPCSCLHRETHNCPFLMPNMFWKWANVVSVKIKHKPYVCSRSRNQSRFTRRFKFNLKFYIFQFSFKEYMSIHFVIFISLSLLPWSQKWRRQTNLNNVYQEIILNII